MENNNKPTHYWPIGKEEPPEGLKKLIKKTKKIIRTIYNKDGGRTVYYEDGSFKKFKNGKVVSGGGPKHGNGKKSITLKKYNKGGSVNSRAIAKKYFKGGMV